MFKVTNILNPLTGGSTVVEYEQEKGKSLEEYVGFTGECIVSCGQNVIGLPLDEIFPADKEEYTVLVVPKGGDSGTWAALGSMMTQVGGFLPGGWPMAAFVGSMLISSFLKEKNKGRATSQSYAWQYGSNYKAPYGTPMPIIYGKTRVRPVLKNRYVVRIDSRIPRCPLSR